MARPPLKDDAILEELALIIVQQPDIKFAKAFRLVVEKPGLLVSGNSPDAFRRRVQRKFNKQRRMLIEHAELELLERRRESSRRAKENLMILAQNVQRLSKSLEPMRSLQKQIAGNIDPRVARALQQQSETVRLIFEMAKPFRQSIVSEAIASLRPQTTLMKQLAEVAGSPVARALRQHAEAVERIGRVGKLFP